MTQGRYVVIMAGGRGERFWPQSRLARPKQLLPIVGEEPMLAQTVDRLLPLVPAENLFIITNREQRAAVLEVCPGVPPGQVVGEPVGRDTAAAVGLAAVLVGRRDPGGTFAMLPADHVIHDGEGYRSVMEAAFETAEAEPDALVTIGVEPDAPATGFGYIHRGEEAARRQGHPVFAVQRFVEKPDRATAESYLASGEYYWNAGMFIWKTGAISAALERHAPGLWAALRELADGLDAGGDLDALMEAHYPGLEKISIDFAVMEKAEKVLVVRSAFDWDDVGEWPAVARHSAADAAGNFLRGLARVRGGSNNIVVSGDGHLTALIGVDDLIVVHAADATLVCPRSKAQEIKELVKDITADPDLQGFV